MTAGTRIRFGVLGTSRIAKKAVLPAIVASPLSTLVMVGSRTPERGNECAVEFGCAAGTYEEVINNPDIDAVYISLPNTLHAEWAIRALNAKKHVWCEKPAALSLKEAADMVDASRRNNARLMEGFMFLSHPQHEKVRELVRGGALGEPLVFNGCFSFPMPDDATIRMDLRFGGGTYNDMAVYPIRASRMIFNAEPDTVFCALTVAGDTGVDVKADVVLTYGAGKSAHISTVFGGAYRSTYSVLGTKAYLELERAYAVPKDTAVKIMLTKDDVTTEITINGADQFRLMLEEFCGEIALGTKSSKDYEQDLLAQARVLEAGRLSNAESRVVHLAEMR